MSLAFSSDAGRRPILRDPQCPRNQPCGPVWANGISTQARPTRFSCYTDIVGRKNVTITLDEEVARWARIRAAERDTSVSRLVGELLREKMLEDQSYEAAMREYLTRPARKLKSNGTKYPRRADLYGQ